MFHYASLWGWIWDAVVIALMAYWSREAGEGPEQAEEERRVRPAQEWRGPRLHR